MPAKKTYIKYEIAKLGLFTDKPAKSEILSIFFSVYFGYLSNRKDPIIATI